MATQNLVSFKKNSITAPIRPLEAPESDCFSLSKLGLIHRREVIVLGGRDDGGDLKELRPEVLGPVGLTKHEYSGLILARLKKYRADIHQQAFSDLVLEHLGDEWILELKSVKAFMALQPKHFRLITEANEVGFSLSQVKNGAFQAKVFLFCRKYPQPIDFSIRVLRSMDRRELMECEPASVADESHPLKIDPYPLNLEGEYQIVREGNLLRAYKAATWVSKPYKTFRGARNCAIKQWQEESKPDQKTIIPGIYNIAPAQEALSHMTLEKKLNYADMGIMTRRQFVKKMHGLGANAKVAQVPKFQYSRSAFNRMDAKEQRKYEAKLKEYKTEYQIHHPGGSHWAVTKTEYDYFQSMEIGVVGAVDSI
jgi:hypothetical protein